MKKIALATVLSLVTSSAFAGGVVEPVMDPEIFRTQNSSSAADVIVPLLLLVVIAAAVVSNN